MDDLLHVCVVALAVVGTLFPFPAKSLIVVLRLSLAAFDATNTGQLTV